MNVLELPYGTEEDESVLRESSIIGVYQIWHKKPGKSITTWHRLRGPAVLFETGHEIWYRYGVRHTPSAHEKMMWELRKKNECS